MRGYEPRSVAWLDVGENAAGSQEKVELLECGVCFAAVLATSFPDHYVWHSNERHLRE